MLGLAETRVKRLSFAKPSTKVLNLAKPRAEGTWTSRKKGGKGGGCRNKDGRRARFWKIDSATVAILSLWLFCMLRVPVLSWMGSSQYMPVGNSVVE